MSMSDTISLDTAPTDASDSKREKRVAACLSCRKSKLRCVKASEDATICTRCSSMHLECTIPEYRVGRHKGTKNKYTGLEKSVRNIEKALEGSTGSVCDPSRLKTLLEQASQKLNLKRKREEDEHTENALESDLSVSPVPNMHRLSGFNNGAFNANNQTNEFQRSGQISRQPQEQFSHSPTLSMTSLPPPSIPSTSEGFQSSFRQRQMSNPSAFSSSQFTPASFMQSPPENLRQIHRPSSRDFRSDLMPQYFQTQNAALDPLLHQSPFSSTQSHYSAPSPDSSIDQVQNAENPLGLLASVSQRIDFQQATPASSLPASLQKGKFFKTKAHRLDVTPELDPISLGLVTTDEANLLVDTFYSQLAHTRWGLCSAIHTVVFIRSRSSLLLTAVMLGASKFLQGHEAITKRLQHHLSLVLRAITEQGYKSIEIVLGLLCCIPWQSPGDNVTEDPTSFYLAMAINIALDLSLDRKISETEKPKYGQLSILHPRTALAIDGFAEVDPQCWMGRQLLRSRERAWLALYVLDRGFALARGRPPMVPLTAAVAACDTWHESSDADFPGDASIAGAAVLRRDMDQVIDKIKQLSDQSNFEMESGDRIKDEVDGYFQSWHAKWDRAINKGQSGFPPYLDILIQHTKLSIYGSVVNYFNASAETSSHLGQWGLSAALNVMRAAVQGEHRLKSMPNNCAVMVSYAVCFVLGIYAKPQSFGSTIEPSVRLLIDQVIAVLLRIGSVPEHRRGMSAVYGRSLQEAIAKVPFKSEVNTSQQPVSSSYGSSSSTMQTNSITSSNLFDMPVFSSMTDIQLQNAVGFSNPSIDFDASLNNGLEWMNWLTNAP